MTEIDRDAPVLVTGGSGYIAGWIVKLLVEQGRTVHATTRSLDKAAHLASLGDDAPGSVKLFEADLLEPGSFDAPMQGCQLVIHTASPFRITGIDNPAEELVRPAVEGTRNVLDAVDRTESVRRVVLTSSVAAIYGDNVDLQGIAGGVLTEAHWNTSSSLEHNPYPYSKVAAEREAVRKQAAQDRWDLVVINPSLVLGPSLTKNTRSGSVTQLLRFGNGTYRTGVADLELGMVDVREVAQAHIAAGDTPSAAGRYILSAQVVSLLEIGRRLRKFFPRHPLPRFAMPKPLVWLVAPIAAGITREYVSRNMGYPLRMDNSKSQRELQTSYRPLDDTLREHFEQLIHDGLVSRR